MYWMLDDNDLKKIKEIELIEVTKTLNEVGETFETSKAIKVSKEWLIKKFNENNSMFKNIESVSNNSITVSKKSYNIFDFLDESAVDILDTDGSLKQFPGALMFHECARSNSMLDDDKLREKLVTYMEKLKMLGDPYNYNINIDNLTLYSVDKLGKEHQMAPVRRVNCQSLHSKTFGEVRVLKFSNETTHISFPFHSCKNIENIIFGKYTEEIDRLYMINRLKTLDIGGAYHLPSINTHLKVEKLIVSTRCKLVHNNNCPLYNDKVDIKQLVIKEFEL